MGVASERRDLSWAMGESGGIAMPPPPRRWARATAAVAVNKARRRVIILTCYRILMARAASRAMVVSEMAAWIIIKPLAQRESTGTSVGEKAVLVLKARNR